LAAPVVHAIYDHHVTDVDNADDRRADTHCIKPARDHARADHDEAVGGSDGAPQPEG
jgi:hypothetical protein